ncbi:MAG: hypothetical protein U0R19_22535 [Bryobacteraceae bacterium]
MRIFLSFVVLLAFCADLLTAQRRKRGKKSEEEITQTLEVPKDPPAAVVGDAQRFLYLNAPLSAKGLLSQQTRDGLKALRRLAKGATILKIRAFVAGTGDLRRVQAIVSEEFTDWRAPLPALTTILVGGLPQEGAQVLLEAIAVEKKPVNPHGVVLFSGQQVTSKEPLEKIEPIFRKSLDNLSTAVKGVGITDADVLRVTCFSSTLGDHTQQRQMLVERFPKAAHTIVQVLRGLTTGLVECEAVGRAAAGSGGPLKTMNPAGLEASPNYSQAVILNAPKVILSGGQMAFRAEPADIRLAFERLGKTVEQVGGNLKRTAMTSYYPLATSTIDKIRQIRFEYLDKAQPPASTMLLFEGLPSMDASFVMEVIALP